MVSVILGCSYHGDVRLSADFSEKILTKLSGNTSY